MLVDDVYQQIERDFGLLAEAFTLHRPVPELLAATWSTFRETVIARGRLRRAVKEAVAMAVSASNQCGYCVDAHAAVLHALGEGAVERTLRARRRPPDPEIEAFVVWAEATRSADTASRVPPPFGPEQEPEAVGTALGFHYVNRMATVLLGETPLPARAAWLKSPLLRATGLYLSRPARADHRPGESLGFLPPAEVPAHLAWAAASPPVQAAFARFDAAVDRAARGRIDPATQELLLARLGRWQGEELPFGDEWVREVTAGLEPAQAAAARLALLAALAPHRIDERELAAFRSQWPGEAPLVATLAWGSFQAARRISEWLARVRREGLTYLAFSNPSDTELMQ